MGLVGLLGADRQGEIEGWVGLRDGDGLSLVPGARCIQGHNVWSVNWHRGNKRLPWCHSSHLLMRMAPPIPLLHHTPTELLTSEHARRGTGWREERKG